MKPDRRSFLRTLLALPIAASVDVEKLLWTPKPIVTVPAMPAKVHFMSNPTGYTLADWALCVDPDGRVEQIGEFLAQTNDLLENMVWREGNLPIYDERAGVPPVFWRLLNEGRS